MSTPPRDYYDNLVAKSQISDNYASATHLEINNKFFIPCDQIENFFTDSIFYMHLYNSLYLELYRINEENNYDIEKLRSIKQLLNIKIDVSSTTRSSGEKMGALIITNDATTNDITSAIFTFYINALINNYNNYNNYPQGVSSSGSIVKSYNVTLANETGTAGTGGIARVIVNTMTGDISSITVISGGSGYTSSVKIADVSQNEVKLRGLLLTATVSSGAITALAATAANNQVKIKYNLSITGNATATILINRYTGIHDTPTVTSAGSGYSSSTAPTITLSDHPALIFTGVLSGTGLGSISTTGVSSFYDTGAAYNNLKPKINNITKINISNLSNTLHGTVTSNVYTYMGSDNFNINSISDPSPNFTKTVTRQKKFRSVINEILITPVENVMSYLFYNKIYYNIIVCNTSIQRYIRNQFLNTNAINMSLQSPSPSISSVVTNINTHTDEMKTNLINLKNSITDATRDFIADKSKYADKIGILNNTRDEHNNIQDNLNNVIKNYNQHIDNYKRLKTYASIVIVFLIIIIIATIVITVLPQFNNNSKNTYYILMLVILIILTFLFYNNFSHVSLYETFGIADTSTISIDCNVINNYNPNHPDAQTRNYNLINNYGFFNGIIDKINVYNNTYNDLNNSLGSIVFIGNNRSFSEDANNYLYKLFIEKRRTTDANRLKKISYINLIEAIKQQVIYLFNMILLISLLTIILLLSIIGYINMPQALNYVFVFAAIAIVIVSLIFIYSMIRPTRLMAKKNYWADNNPSDDTINNL